MQVIPHSLPSLFCQIDGCGCKTHTHWFTQWVVNSPTAYKPEEITPEFMKDLRYGGDKKCEFWLMVDSAKDLFQRWADSNAADIRDGRTPPHVSAESALSIGTDDLAQFVKAAGFQPLSSVCPLMARKFPTDTRMAVANSLLDCNGGGLSSSCKHPQVPK